MNQTQKHSDVEVYTKVAALGAVAGLRAMLAPALVSYAASRGEKSGASESFFASRGVSIALGLLAVGELIGDKLPTTPNRTAPFGLGARIVSGAFVGGLICANHEKAVPTGIALGALTAVAAAYTGETLRRTISVSTGIPSPLIGVLEDATAVGIGAAALKIGK